MGSLILNSNRNLVISCVSKFQVQNVLLTIRCLATHWDPKFKKLRRDKVVKPKLPDFEKIRKGNAKNESETKEELRARRIKEGFEPPVSFEYMPLNFASSTEIIDPFVAPEGDGKASIFDIKEFAKDKVAIGWQKIKKFAKHKRVIANYDASFNEEFFCELAKEIYVNAHKTLMKRDEEKLLEYVTEHAYGKMWTNMKFKTLKWDIVEELEQPSIKNIVTREMSSKKEIFGQITVRFHTKQLLAIYDRFGRLSLGSDKLPKDILEYVVFERYLTNPYTSWRMHDKIIPEWLPPKHEILRTFTKPKPYKINELTEKPESKFKKEDTHLEEEKLDSKANV